MPNEPERDIEKTLKSYANKRREEAGAPRPLHPATRKMLREEALRTHGKERESGGSWLLFSWPGLAYAASMVAGLGLAAWLMFPRTTQRSEYSIAMNRARQSEPAVFKSIPGSAPMAADNLEDVQKRRIQNGRAAELKDKNATTPAENANAAAPALALADSDRKAKAPESGRGNDGVSHLDFPKEKEQPESHPETSAGRAMNGTYAETLAPSAAPALPAESPPPAAPPPVVATSGAVSAGDVPLAGQNGSIGGAGGGGGFGGPAVAVNKPANLLNEQFTRVNTFDASGAAQKKLDAANVLALFRVEKDQQQIRVIDSDGSVYAGFVVQPALETKSEGVFATGGRLRDLTPSTNAALNYEHDSTSSAAAAGGGIPSGQNIFFRVSGTNRSLNQPVVFTGAWQAGTARQPALQALSGSLEEETKTGLRAAPAQTNAGRVTGRAVVGGTNQFEINAVVKP